LGCGDEGAVWVEVPFFFGAALVNDAVEIAETKKKTPANAIVLSMRFSCGEVIAYDAGPPTTRAGQRRSSVTQQPAHHGKTLFFQRAVSGNLF
jgi:hypothetical protein